MKQVWIIVGVGAAGCLILAGMLLFLGDSPPSAAPAGQPPQVAAAPENPVAAPAAEPAPEQVREDVAAEPPAPAPAAVMPSDLANLELPADEVNEIRNKLKQIALGFLNYESAKRRFPPGDDQKGNFQLSWRVHILPFLDQGPLYKRFHMDEPWDSPHNKALLEFMPDLYRTGNEEGTETRFVVFTGEQALFHEGRAAAMRSCSDGTSNTLLAIHSGGGMRAAWTKPDDAVFDAAAPLANVGFVNGRLEGVLVDASLVSLPYDIPPATVAGLVTPAGNEIVDGRGLARRYAAVRSATERPAATAAPSGPNAQHAAMSRLKIVVLGMHNSESARGAFPAAVEFRRPDDPASPGVSWRVMMLPFLEQQPLFGRYKTGQPWDSDENRALLNQMPADYRHESSVDDTATRLQVFVGPGTPFGIAGSRSRRGPQLKEIVDGSSNTIMTIESGRDRAVPWLEPRDLEFDAAAPLASLGDLDATGTYAAMFDGSVRIIDRDIDPQVMANLALARDQSDPNWAAAAEEEAVRVAQEMRDAEAAARAASDAATAPPAEAAASQATELPVDDTPDARFAVHHLERPGFDFAYDRLTGQLLVAEYENNQARLYRLDDALAEAAALPCPARPTATLAKRFKDASFFLVGGKLDKRVDVFNGQDGARTESIYLQTPGVYEFAASERIDDPYVYYVSSRGESGNYYIGRINIEKLADEGELTSGGGMALSADGSMIYVRDSPNESGSLRVARIVEGGQQEASDSERLMCPAGAEFMETNSSVSSTVMAAGPGNALFAAGNVLTSTTLKDTLGEFEFPVFAFFPDKPWAVGVDQRRLHVGSVNDKRLAAVLNLPASFEIESLIQRRVEDPVKQLFTRANRVNPVFIDAQRGRIIVASEQDVAVASVESLQLPDEPLVAAQCSANYTAQAGEALEIPVSTFDPRVKLRLATVPQGATLSDGVLRWTPRGRDIGATTVLVESRLEPVRFEQRLEINVTRPHVPTPMTADHVSLSPDGAMAVVWGIAKGAERSSGSEQVERELALIDAATGAIKSKCEIAKGIWLARVDADGVYVLTKPGQTEGQNNVAEALRLNLGDLSLAASGGSVGNANGDMAAILEPVIGKILLAGNERFSLPKMEKRESKLISFNGAYGGYGSSLCAARRTEGDWLFRNVVWDASVKRPQMLFPVASFVGGGQQGNNQVPVGWGRWQDQSSLIAAGNKQILQLSRSDVGGATISADYPALLQLANEVSAEGAPRVVVQVYELVGGSRTQSLVLARRQSQSGYSSDLPRDNAIDAAGETIAACAGGKLYLIRASEVDREALKPPFRVRLRQNPIVLGDDASAEIEYELVDGKPPYEARMVIDGFEARTTTDGTARFALNGKSILDNVVGRFNQYGWPQLQNPRPEVRARVVDYLEAITPEFKELTGRAPKGVPVMVTVSLDATDRALQPTAISHCFLVEVAAARVTRALEPTNQERSRQYSPKTPFAPAPQKAAAERAAAEARRARLGQLDAQLATVYSDDVRKAYPHVKLTDAELARQARRAVQSANASLSLIVARKNAARGQQVRQWSDRSGHKTDGRLVSVFADQVFLELAGGNQVTVPLDKLSDADQKIVADSQQADEVTPADMAVAQMELLTQALDRHVRRTGGYPPAYICDPAGKALLSWRAALLPDMGAGDLFELFHFDEPWNSPHNRQLGAFMPLAYAPARSGAARKNSTTILAFRDDGAVLADSRSLTAADVADGGDSVVVLGEVRTVRVVPWSQPADIPAGDFAKLDAILEPHGSYFVVGLAGGRVAAVPVETAKEAWATAIGRADGQMPPVQFQPPAAAIDAEGEPLSLRRLQGPLRRTAEDAANDAAYGEGVVSEAGDGPVALSGRELGAVVTRVSGDAMRSRAASGSPGPTVKFGNRRHIGDVVARATGAPEGYLYQLVDSDGTFAVNALTGEIAVERPERINPQLYPSHLIKVVAVNARQERAPVTVVGVEEGEER